MRTPSAGQTPRPRWWSPPATPARRPSLRGQRATTERPHGGCCCEQRGAGMPCGAAGQRHAAAPRPPAHLSGAAAGPSCAPPPPARRGRAQRPRPTQPHAPAAAAGCARPCMAARGGGGHAGAPWAVMTGGATCGMARVSRPAYWRCSTAAKGACKRRHLRAHWARPRCSPGCPDGMLLGTPPAGATPVKRRQEVPRSPLAHACGPSGGGGRGWLGAISGPAHCTSARCLNQGEEEVAQREAGEHAGRHAAAGARCRQRTVFVGQHVVQIDGHQEVADKLNEQDPKGCRAGARAGRGACPQVGHEWRRLGLGGPPAQGASCRRWCGEGVRCAAWQCRGAHLWGWAARTGSPGRCREQRPAPVSPGPRCSGSSCSAGGGQGQRRGLGTRAARAAGLGC